MADHEHALWNFLSFYAASPLAPKVCKISIKVQSTLTHMLACMHIPALLRRVPMHLTPQMPTCSGHAHHHLCLPQDSVAGAAPLPAPGYGNGGKPRLSRVESQRRSKLFRAWSLPVLQHVS